MKTTMVLLSFLLFAFSTNPNPLLGAAAQEAVLDTSGQRVRTGVDYYILPAEGGSGGGLTLGRNRNGSNCPLDVVQEQSNTDNGYPVMFTSVNPNEGVVRLITDQNIQFSAVTICISTNLWKLADFDEAVGRSFVTIGGVKGNPGRETLSNWFRIEKYDDDYKLVFCPSVCGVNEGCRVLCGDLGIFVDNGVRRLALSEQPLKVTFKKA